MINPKPIWRRPVEVCDHERMYAWSERRRGEKLNIEEHRFGVRSRVVVDRVGLTVDDERF